ncbi:MAG: ABC transporter ATP-binding protein [candidate division WOR-3 bacterium]
MVKRQNGLNVVFSFWRKHKLLALGLFIGTVFGALVAVVVPYVLRIIVDGIKQGITSEKIVRYVLLLVGFGILRAVADVILPFCRGRVNERYQWQVRSEVFQKILNQGQSFVNRFPSGDVMERLDHDMGELSWFACSGIFRFISAALLVLFTLTMLLRMNPILTAVTVLPTALLAFGWIRMGPKVYRWFMKWREKIAEINNQLQSAFTGIRLVKAFVTEERLTKQFHKTLTERVAVAVNEARAESKIQVLYMGIAEIATLVVLWVGGIQVIGKSLTLGEFVAFNAYLLMLMQPMFDIGNLFVTGKRAQGAGERIGELTSHLPDIERKGSAKLLNKLAPGELKLERVSFNYDSKPVLKEVAMVFPLGKKVGIAGTVGSGKSTILKLLLRLIEPQTGRVLLNGTDIRQFDLEEYRQLFGYVPQEPSLFSDTLRNNIIFGREVETEELKRVIDIAQLSRDVAELPKGLDELLGERGTGLSGGQKARVAIARALLKMPPIIIFDDATSALDADTEQALLNRLIEELKGRTLLLISHRLSTLNICDYIYVLDQGEVKEEGVPEELLTQKGLYWQLYQRQLLKEELERL